MPRSSAALGMALLAALAARAEEPAPGPPTATSDQAVPFRLDLAVRLEAREGKRAVVIEGPATLPEKTIVECHLYVTFGTVAGRERSNFVDGRSGIVEGGRCTVTMGPYAMALGTYRVEWMVDPQRQYPGVREALQKAGDPDVRGRSEFKIGKDEEIAEEREIGRPRMLHSAERILSLGTELLDHVRDLKGPLERGDWEASWLEHARRLRGRLVPVAGEVVGQNQMSRPLAEQYDRTEMALLDCVRALLKAYQEAAQLPPPAREEGGVPPWPEAVTAPALQALTARALDVLAADYQQDILIRLEGILRNARSLHQAAAQEEDPARPAHPNQPPPKQQWASQSAAWLSSAKELKEELSLLTDETSPRPFIKQMGRRLLPERARLLALAGEVETVVKGLGRALAAGKPPADEVPQAIDRFYASYAAFLVTSLGGSPP